MRHLRSIFLMTLLLLTITSFSQQYVLPKQNDRWKIQPDGSIEWLIDKRVPHYDHIEMGGQKVALWMQYGVDSSSKSEYTRTVVFPTHRLLPQRTIAHMTYSVKDGDLPRILVNDRLLEGGVVHNAAVVNALPEKVIS